MAKRKYQPIYDITKTVEENLELGPNPDFVANLKAPDLKKKFEILGHKVSAPFGASASPTGLDRNYIKRMFDNGYDIVTTKTRRSVHYAPHAVPNVVHIVQGRLSRHDDFEALRNRVTSSDSDYKTLTIANSFGNNSLDPEYWVPDAKLSNSYAKNGKLLITSVFGTIQEGFETEDYYQDFATTALLAKQSGAQAIEINFSCPNVLGEGVLCYDPEAVATITTLVKAAVDGTPLVAKLGYFPPGEQHLLEQVAAAAAPHVAAINAINTFAAPVYDEFGNQAMPGKGRLKAGLSGHAIKELGIDMCRRLAEIRAKNGYGYQVFSAGGVLTPKDFQDYRDAGADCVLSATGAMFNPNLALEIKQHLA